MEIRSNIEKDEVEKQGQEDVRQMLAKIEEGAGERARGSLPSTGGRKGACARQVK
jgi:hypothetical protein